MTVSVPRARVTDSNGRQAEWRSKVFPAYKRLTVQGRAADRRRLSGRHQHATGPARLGGAVRRGSWQDTACMLFWALLARGQITLHKVDGWNTLHVAAAEHLLDLAARTANLTTGDDRHRQFPPSSRRDPRLCGADT